MSRARFNHRRTPPRTYGAEHKALRPLVFARDGHRCVECGSTDRLQLGHIDRLGPDSMANSKTQCRTCNLRQASREARGLGPAEAAPPHPGLLTGRGSEILVSATSPQTRPFPSRGAYIKRGSA